MTPAAPTLMLDTSLSPTSKADDAGITRILDIICTAAQFSDVSGGIYSHEWAWADPRVGEQAFITKIIYRDITGAVRTDTLTLPHSDTTLRAIGVHAQNCVRSLAEATRKTSKAVAESDAPRWFVHHDVISSVDGVRARDQRTTAHATLGDALATLHAGDVEKHVLRYTLDDGKEVAEIHAETWIPESVRVYVEEERGPCGR